MEQTDFFNVLDQKKTQPLKPSPEELFLDQLLAEKKDLDKQVADCKACQGERFGGCHKNHMGQLEVLYKKIHDAESDARGK